MAVISGAILGGLKVALKSAAKKVGEQALVEVAKGGAKALTNKAVQETLKDIAVKAMTDGQAVLLNRLKSAPTKALWDFASAELGLPVKEVKKIVKLFNQSQKAKDFSLGQNFKDSARAKLKKELKTNINDSIKDMVRKADEINKLKKKVEGGTPTLDYNSLVLGVLINLENELDLKIHGVSNLQDKHKRLLDIDTSLIDYYDPKKEYKYYHVLALEKIITNILIDIEFYLAGGDEPYLIETGAGDWDVSSKNFILNYIKDIKHSVRTILNN